MPSPHRIFTFTILFEYICINWLRCVVHDYAKAVDKTNGANRGKASLRVEYYKIRKIRNISARYQAMKELKGAVTPFGLQMPRRKSEFFCIHG